jgi:hypothetical protein
LGLVGDAIEYINPSRKKDGYKVIEGRSDRSVIISRETIRDRARRPSSSLAEYPNRNDADGKSVEKQVKKEPDLATEGICSVTVE